MITYGKCVCPATEESYAVIVLILCITFLIWWFTRKWRTMNKKYLILCRAIKYKHINLVDYYGNELFPVLSDKHILWLMRYMNKNGLRWSKRLWQLDLVFCKTDFFLVFVGMNWKRLRSLKLTYYLWS